MPDPEQDQKDLYDVITKVNVFIRTWEVDLGPQIKQGNYDISKILELLEIQFRIVFTNKTINLRINLYQYRVEINPNLNFAIACYSKRYILSYLDSGYNRLL